MINCHRIHSRRHFQNVPKTYGIDQECVINFVYECVTHTAEHANDFGIECVWVDGECVEKRIFIVYCRSVRSSNHSTVCVCPDRWQKVQCNAHTHTSSVEENRIFSFSFYFFRLNFGFDSQINRNIRVRPHIVITHTTEILEPTMARVQTKDRNLISILLCKAY